MKQRKNQGFTLVEMVIIVTIFAVLLGILIPSLNSVLGFEAQRATQSVCAALDRTKREAMSRIVGEMELYYKAGDGYYVKYYLDRGRAHNSLGEGEQEEEKIAKSRAVITYTDSAGGIYDIREDGPLFLTYDRKDGSFRNILEGPVTSGEMRAFVEDEDSYEELDYHESSAECKAIIIECGMRKRTIELEQLTGTYTVKPN